MATITPIRIASPHDGAAFTCWKWGPFDHGDTLLPVIVAPYSDKTVKFVKSGAFGGNAGLEGSMVPDESDGYLPVLDSQHVAISGITASTVRTIMAHVYRLRPTTTTGLTGVTAYLTLATGGR
jgi:hypothetical protein